MDTTRNFTISEDQNTVTIDGVTTTFTTFKKSGVRATCHRCWYYDQEDNCHLSPCTAEERSDGREGYFTIQEFPKEK